MSERRENTGLTNRSRVDLHARLVNARNRLLAEHQGASAELFSITENRDAELEERAQVETAADMLARLEARRADELRSIEHALARIADGTYGGCTLCGARISVARLRTVPSAATCGPCATVVAEGGSPAPTRGDLEDVRPSKPTIPSELALLDDEEIGDLVRERFYERAGEALDDVRVVCRHGVVRLAGEVADGELRRLALRIVEDELDLEATDRIRTSPFAREHDAERAGPAAMSGDELLDAALAGGESSEDIFEIEELGCELTRG